MNREIKFRGKKGGGEEWVYGSLIISTVSNIRHYHIRQEYTSGFRYCFEVSPKTVGQFTGYTEDNVDYYEGDVIEEDLDSELGKEKIYCIITWIKEWCMFGCLLLPDEHKSYLEKGAEGLDESMFWTFPLQKENFGKRTIVGNIHDNPELLYP